MAEPLDDQAQVAPRFHYDRYVGPKFQLIRCQSNAEFPQYASQDDCEDNCRKRFADTDVGSETSGM